MSWTPKYNKLGPPKNVKLPPYHPALEALETESNKLCIKEYEQDISNYLSILENNSYISCSMIDLQPEIQWYMRPFLLDFLVEIHQSFRLHPQTLFLAVNIIDKYCSKRVVFKRHYQLVGSTALWLAAKYEDKKSRVPTLKELTIMCRNAYDAEMFVQMEKHILSTLEWSLSFTSLEDCLQISLNNSLKFLNETPRRIGLKSYKKSNLQTKIEILSRFFCELSLYERNYLQFPSSVISIACHLLSSRILNSESALNSFENSIHNYLKNFKEIDDDATFDEDLENNYPNVTQPFLSGFSTDSTIDQMIIICSLLINSIQNCSHALQNKYKKYGSDSFNYIQLVKDFIYKYNNVVQLFPDSEPFNNLKDYEISSGLTYAGSYLLGLTTTQQNLQQQQQQEQKQHPEQQQPDDQPQFVQPQIFNNLSHTPPSASSTISSIFSSNDFSNYSASSLIMTPTTNSSPIDPNYYHHHQQQYVKNNVFYNNPSQIDSMIFTKPNDIQDPEYGTFMNKRQRPYQEQNPDESENENAPGSSPLAQRSLNKMNMMV